MKRALKELQEDERVRQEDNLLRAQLEREEANEAVQKKKKALWREFSERWKANLQKWDELGLQIASGRQLTLPVPDPPGTFSRPLVFTLSPFSLYFSLYFLLFLVFNKILLSTS